MQDYGLVKPVNNAPFERYIIYADAAKAAMKIARNPDSSDPRHAVVGKDAAGFFACQGSALPDDFTVYRVVEVFLMENGRAVAFGLRDIGKEVKPKNTKPEDLPLPKVSLDLPSVLPDMPEERTSKIIRETLTVNAPSLSELRQTLKQSGSPEDRQKALKQIIDLLYPN